MVVVAVEIMAGEAVSEQIPDSQEVTVTSVVCLVDFELEIGHQVVYSVATPLTVVVEVEMRAGETVLEQMLEPQEVMVTKVVCSRFSVATGARLGTVVLAWEAVEVILSSIVCDWEIEVKDSFIEDFISVVKLIVSVWFLKVLEVVLEVVEGEIDKELEALNDLEEAGVELNS